MNKPDDFDCWRLPDDGLVQKVTCLKDTKVQNAMMYVIEREDHTLGNIMRMHMLDDEDVVFSGYRVVHPLEPAIQLKVQTRNEHITPTQAVQATIHSLISELDQMEERFKTSLIAKKNEYVAT